MGPRMKALLYRAHSDLDTWCSGAHEAKGVFQYRQDHNKNSPSITGGVLRCRHWLKQDARWNISLPKELYTQLKITQNYLTSDSNARSFSYPLLMTPQPFERTRMIEESGET